MRIFLFRSDSPTEGASGNVPLPPSERRAWIVAVSLGLLGVAILALLLSGTVGRSAEKSAFMPPPVPFKTPTPMPARTIKASSRRLQKVAGESHRTRRAPIVDHPSKIQQSRDVALFADLGTTHISEAWMSGFYPIYSVAQSTFGVNWLLIASIHRQESAFSTAPSTYHGLNFAGCCGGPMQFNVTNGTPSTWELVSNSYVYGKRPAVYDHMTATHPSIYDDFDAIMAAAHLLSADGAGFALGGSAWDAAYDYYGHDLTGVTYADQVLARAISWSQSGFCINCEPTQAMVQDVDAAYGAPVRAALQAQSTNAVAASTSTAKRAPAVKHKRAPELKRPRDSGHARSTLTAVP